MLFSSFIPCERRIFKCGLILFGLLLIQIKQGSARRVVLLDTTNATSELKWATYTNMDEEDSGWLEETYRGDSGLDNRRAYVACNVDLPEVDNWLRTPRIERGAAHRLHVEVTFTMRDCRLFPGKARSCKETFQLYVAESSSSIGVPLSWDEKSWTLVDRITADTGRYSDHNLSNLNVEIRSATVNESTVFFAFRDSGACVSILNVKVFYEECATMTNDFVRFDRTVAGAEATSIQQVKGFCVANASPDSVISPPQQICKADGEWTMPSGKCVCNPGFVASQQLQTCTACPSNSYKAPSGDGQCLPCPANSSAEHSGSAACQCDQGYYRAAYENVSERCTQPPSKPSHLHVIRLDTSSATLGWEEPWSTGGRQELWYRYRCQQCGRAVVMEPPREMNTTGRTLQLSGLEPGTQYTVLVFAENDVSAMVSGPKAYALVEFTTRSAIGVFDLRLESFSETGGLTIAWRLAEDNASVQMFQVQSEVNGRTTVLETQNLYYTFPSIDPTKKYSFKVRARTRDGWGTWSAMLRVQSGTVVPDDVQDNSSISTSPWLLALIAAAVAVLFAILLVVCFRNTLRRKQMSDVDILDPYKDNVGPDYNSHSSLAGAMRNKSCAPLIGYDLVQRGGGYTNRFSKPYVDPTAYEDPNQAISEFTNQIEPERVYIVNAIASGEFGDVCKGQLVDRNAANALDVAIKTLKQGSSAKERSNFLTEASIMGQFDHENVIRLIGVVTEREPVMIITEYMANKSLDQYVRTHEAQLNISTILVMLRGIAAGMHYLTELKAYVHRDLAARNVLVDANLTCKIADFGLSRGLEGSVEQEYNAKGGKIPVRWTAPEAISHNTYTAYSDVWSMGIVMWEVCSFGMRPYWDWTNRKVIEKVDQGYRLPRPEHTPAGLYRLMEQCWEKERRSRPTFSRIVAILSSFIGCPETMSLERTGSSMLPIYAEPSQIYASLTPLEEFLRPLCLDHLLPGLIAAGVRRPIELQQLSQGELRLCGLNNEQAALVKTELLRQSTGAWGTSLPRRPAVYQQSMATLPAVRSRGDAGFFV